MTTIHGFAYWVRGETLVEKVFWVAIVAAGFVCSGFNISYAIRDWLQEPGVTVIKTFSKVSFVKVDPDCKVNFVISYPWQTPLLIYV